MVASLPRSVVAGVCARALVHDFPCDGTASGGYAQAEGGKGARCFDGRWPKKKKPGKLPCRAPPVPLEKSVDETLGD
jgi:hypothetical protein